MRRSLLHKIPAMVGVCCSTSCFLAACMAGIARALLDFTYSYAYMAFPLNLHDLPLDWVAVILWMFGIFASLFCVVCFAVDAVFCVIHIFRNRRRIFHIILTIVLLGGIPMMNFCVSWGLGNILIWNLYHLLMCVLEVISILLIVKDVRAEKTQAANAVLPAEMAPPTETV